MLLALLLALLAFPEIGAPGREAEVLSACSDRMSSSAHDAPAQTYAIGDDGLCFTGPIDAESSAAFVQALNKTDPDAPLVVVVRSGGGEVNAGMAMGEALIPRVSTVITHQICASSCANYLFTAADRRVIDDQAVLMFHGGVFPKERSAVRAGLEELVPPDQLEGAVESVLADIDAQIARQDAFLLKAGVDVDFFRWMGRIADLPPDQMREICAPPGAGMIVYSDELLAAHKVMVHENRGPTTSGDVEASLTTLGTPGFACFMDRFVSLP